MTTDEISVERTGYLIKKYPYIVAWGKALNHTPEMIRINLLRADFTKAPKDAIFFDEKDGHWSRFDILPDKSKSIIEQHLPGGERSQELRKLNIRITGAYGLKTPTKFDYSRSIAETDFYHFMFTDGSEIYESIIPVRELLALLLDNNWARITSSKEDNNE